jgi:pimeloyl-ACP methyl ester carboxylesterase
MVPRLWSDIVTHAGAFDRRRSALHARQLSPGGEEPLDESLGLMGMGRSTTFPFPQWRANDEFRTVYFDVGEGPQTLVLVHGLGANLTHWEYVAKYLARRYRVLGLDLPGCGASLKPRRRYTLDLLRDHLLGFLDEHGVEHPTLVGHSLGGAVCLAATLERPGLAERLVLVGGACVARLPAWMRRGAPLFLHERLLYPTLRFGHNFILRNVFVDGPAENEFVRHFRQMALRDDLGFPHLHDFARVSATLCRDIVERDFSGQLPTLDIPILGIWGKADKLTPLSDVRASLARAPRSRLIVLERCGHMPMVERPHDVLYHVEQFLKNPP